MLRCSTVLLLAIIHHTILGHTHCKSTNTLDQALSNFYKQYPECAHVTSDSAHNNTSEPAISIHTYIDLAALMYGAYQGYTIYNSIYNPSPYTPTPATSIPASTFLYYASYLCPEVIQNLGTHVYFVGHLAQIF